MAFTGSTAGLAAGAQTNDTVLTWALEATYKQSPTGPYQQGRFTAETLSRSQSTSRPSEINTIKEVSQSIVTQVTASG
ncbi:phage tail protein, partial [Acetobacter malorum]